MYVNHIAVTQSIEQLVVLLRHYISVPVGPGAAFPFFSGLSLNAGMESLSNNNVLTQYTWCWWNNETFVCPANSLHYTV